MPPSPAVGAMFAWRLISEVTAAIAGTIGIAPSANLNPEGTYPSLFGPHQARSGPAPRCWTTQDFRTQAPVSSPHSKRPLASGTKTSDLGGTATTEEMADAVVQSLTDHA
jgi:tartrate dehydrogenase/decarboxylase/D-malate dehydrogenase